MGDYDCKYLLALHAKTGIHNGKCTITVEKMHDKYPVSGENLSNGKIDDLCQDVWPIIKSVKKRLTDAGDDVCLHGNKRNTDRSLYTLHTSI